MPFILNVVYPLGPGADIRDSEVDAAVGKRSVSSGAGFGERDLQYEFASADEAEAAKTRVAALDGVSPTVGEEG